MPVISFRVTEEEIRYLKELSGTERKDKSAVARELLSQGRKFLLLQRYRAGKLSLGALAKEWDISLSETIDFLADLGIESPIRYEDYLQGLKTTNKVRTGSRH